VYKNQAEGVTPIGRMIDRSFLCSSDRERGPFTRRITLAILIASACFLAFPLGFSFERPHTTVWFGAVFDAIREMDRPFNQLPSLHIALRTILADMSIVKSATPAAPPWCRHGLS
jgi:membrane-associated phospholipid phosphatase